MSNIRKRFQSNSMEDCCNRKDKKISDEMNITHYAQHPAKYICYSVWKCSLNLSVENWTVDRIEVPKCTVHCSPSFQLIEFKLFLKVLE